MSDNVFIVRIPDYDHTEVEGVYDDLEAAKASVGGINGSYVQEWTVGRNCRTVAQHTYVGRCHVRHHHAYGDCTYEYEWKMEAK